MTYSGSPQPEIRSNVKMIAIATASQKPRCLFASIFSLRYGQRGLPFGNPRNDLGGGTPPLPPRIGATSRPIYYWHVFLGFWLRVYVGRTSPTSAVPAPAAVTSRCPARRFNVGGREEATFADKRKSALLPAVFRPTTGSLGRTSSRAENNVTLPQSGTGLSIGARR